MAEELKTGDKEAFLQDVPEGATISEARPQTLPARTWVDTGPDGLDRVEIYLDADEDARLLVRRVKAPAQLPAT